MSISISIAVFSTVVRSLPPVKFYPNMNAQNALEQAYVGGTGYSFVLQYFGNDLGYEVIAFDGISAQQGSDVGLYWQFIYNGESANQGIDETILNDGDALEFNFVMYDEAKHAGTRLEAVHKALKARGRPA
jgi:hypothetical protein